MKKFLMYTTVLLLTAITTFACSKDKDEDKATSATIQLVDLLGKPVKGVRVYAYDQDTWNMMGDETFHATFQVVSDDAGNATFSNLDKGTQFTSVNNETNTFTFSARSVKLLSFSSYSLLILSPCSCSQFFNSS